LGKQPLVYCDPETLMPMPRALRNQMLFDLYTQGVISLAEYKSRAPFALIQDVYSGEQAQWSRAQRINEVLTQNWQRFDMLAERDPLLPFLPENGVTVLWAANPLVHQAALLELVLDDRKPWKLRRLALERYVIYQELQLAQQGGSVIDPTTGMPMLNPVPLEVVGAPPELPRKQQPSTQRTGGGATLPPGTPATTVVAPELSGAGLPAASLQQAQPLGEFGDVERQFVASGNPLPQ